MEPSETVMSLSQVQVISCEVFHENLYYKPIWLQKTLYFCFWFIAVNNIEITVFRYRYHWWTEKINEILCCHSSLKICIFWRIWCFHICVIGSSILNPS